MVAIVIVSHSAQLAEGVRELAEQMGQGKVPIATAGGIDDPENPLGTDAMRVYEAIASVYDDDGVVVFMDLGSALMSAEMALEFLPEAQREKIHLCDAPLVEGAIAATVQAASGSNIEQVIAEARNALAAKAVQLQAAITPESFEIRDELGTDKEGLEIEEIRLSIRNSFGLHARPAAKFVTTATRFESEISVRNLTRNTQLVNAKSINQLTLLGVRQGDEIGIMAQGNDAAAALSALQALVEENFGEAILTPSTLPPDQGKRTLNPPPLTGELQGIPASPGIAIGTLYFYHPQIQTVTQQTVENPQVEWQHLQTAIATAKQGIQALRQQTASRVGEEGAAIFDAHLLILEDPALLDSVRQPIFTQHLNAAAAWQMAIAELSSRYRNLEDPYLQARAADITDVGQRVLQQLTGGVSVPLELSQPIILVAPDLAPSDTAQFNPQQILGICTAKGSINSHSAILARSLGIPAVVGLGKAVLQLPENTVLALDGESGKVWVQPDSATLTTLQAQQAQQQAVRQQALLLTQYPACTRDGQEVKLLANIGSIADVEAAIKFGAEGVGLLRTEFLYLDRVTAPSEAEQLEVYQAIAQRLNQRPLIIRTLDIGGDKPLPYLKLEPEANPFLGWRGIRLCLAHRELFKTQLRAILRATPGHSIKVMFPMIATLEEVRAAKAILAEAQAELRQAGIPFDAAMEVGIMIEVPSAVVIAAQLAAEVDFFSIGTNDLSQYMMAADRTNPQVASLANALHPAVLRAIQQTVQAAHQGGIWVGLCGELAGQPQATPILLGLGLDELSMSPPAIPTIKQAIAQFTLEEAQAIASDKVLSAVACFRVAVS